MKNTMSKRNVAKFHKLLAEDISIKKISRYMGITEKALKEFTPAKCEANKVAQAARLEAQKAADAETDAAAETLAKAAKTVNKDKATKSATKKDATKKKD